MNIGQKFQTLYKSMNFKNWQEFGKFVNLSGDWCLDISKKKEISTVDVTRLIIVSNKFNVTLDWLLSDEDEFDEEIKQGYNTDDLSVMLNAIKSSITDKTKYHGTLLGKNNSQLAIDAIDEVKRLIQENL